MPTEQGGVIRVSLLPRAKDQQGRLKIAFVEIVKRLPGAIRDTSDYKKWQELGCAIGDSIHIRGVLMGHVTLDGITFYRISPQDFSSHAWGPSITRTPYTFQDHFQFIINWYSLEHGDRLPGADNREDTLIA